MIDCFFHFYNETYHHEKENQAMDANIEEFRDILDNKDGEYVLVIARYTSDGEKKYLVYNTIKKMVLIIEDDEIAKEVINRMIEANVPIFDKSILSTNL